ncbi:hypothetical protein DUNSADRAFT_2616 [Dunaliella salina]|uniref:Encoded protein n=1 Tax=Dunaliella salina TaxID=3046 RepID=A0ABQ7GVF0_DUNSA|nr:hypothetical protein DUNSADRAFT_2616 [Dunaliella salina]|eukprot:KAF5838555.1 hypothetical protein DUNSADRAFT_2616 [Dunaliella salina]
MSIHVCVFGASFCFSPSLSLKYAFLGPAPLSVGGPCVQKMLQLQQDDEMAACGTAVHFLEKKHVCVYLQQPQQRPYTWRYAVQVSCKCKQACCVVAACSSCACRMAMCAQFAAAAAMTEWRHAGKVAGHVCTVRSSRGDDEMAACGQLGGVDGGAANQKAAALLARQQKQQSQNPQQDQQQQLQQRVQNERGGDVGEVVEMMDGIEPDELRPMRKMPAPPPLLQPPPRFREVLRAQQEELQQLHRQVHA